MLGTLGENKPRAVGRHQRWVKWHPMTLLVLGGLQGGRWFWQTEDKTMTGEKLRRTSQIEAGLERYNWTMEWYSETEAREGGNEGNWDTPHPWQQCRDGPQAALSSSLSWGSSFRDNMTGGPSPAVFMDTEIICMSHVFPGRLALSNNVYSYDHTFSLQWASLEGACTETCHHRIAVSS